MMPNSLLITLGKTVSQISKSLNRGNGSTWPGHIALKANKNFIRDILAKSQTKTIIVAGTNGKTTTSGLIKTGLEQNDKTVIQNTSGANLLNGIASTILLRSKNGKLAQDFAIFEVDENALSSVLTQITPDYLVLLNLFRDQLDRYGELNTIAHNWHEVINTLPKTTNLILNADDPQIAFLGLKNKQNAHYFSLENSKEKVQLAADSVSCPNCGNQLIFENNTFSHLGKWKCNNCHLQRPKAILDHFSTYPLSGTYNKYNVHAAALVLKDIGITENKIFTAFKTFKPSFGRQEIIEYKDKKVQLFLSKNPTSFNQSFEAIKNLSGSILLLVLNDRIPDGRDVSWIWDTDLTGITKFKQILVAGDRVYDMALRLKYELGIEAYKKTVVTFENLKDAVNEGTNLIPINETFYILPTYSAMLDVRKIITGKKIL